MDPKEGPGMGLKYVSQETVKAYKWALADIQDGRVAVMLTRQDDGSWMEQPMSDEKSKVLLDILEGIVEWDLPVKKWKSMHIGRQVLSTSFQVTKEAWWIEWSQQDSWQHASESSE
jgi:hypothetical protein